MSDMYYLGVRIDDIHPTAGAAIEDKIIGHAMLALYAPDGSELWVVGMMPKAFEFLSSCPGVITDQ